MRTVVIVDDDPITRLDLADILSRAGFCIVGQGGDGFDGVDLCREHKPDLVLMDIKMPVFDGLDASKTIARENPASCIVMLSAFGDQAFIAKAKEVGVAGYLIKPVDERTLLPAIEIAMEQSRRYHRVKGENESIRKKLQDKNLIDRAKAILAKKDNIDENAAYAAMRKAAMDKSVSIADIANRIVQAVDDREDVDRAKALLMRKNGLGESAAFRHIRALAEKRNISLRQAAKIVLSEDGP